MKNKIIIELFGLSGSGKTTLANTINNYYNTENVKAYSKVARKWRFVLSTIFIIFHPSYFFIFLSLIVKNIKSFNGISLASYKLGLVMDTFAKYQISLLNKSNIVIIDEGFYQRFLGIIEDEVDCDHLISFSKKIHIPDYIINLNNNNNNLFQRYESKNHQSNPRLNQSQGYYIKWKKTTIKNHRMIKDGLRAEPFFKNYTKQKFLDFVSERINDF